MCRYLQAEQVVGYTFVELLERNKYEIALTQFSGIQRKLGEALREENNTVVCLSASDVYSITVDYADFFNMQDDGLCIVEPVRCSIEHDIKARNAFIAKLKSYFIAGIPNDITQTMGKTLQACL